MVSNPNSEKCTTVSPKIVQEKCVKAGVSFWLASEVALALENRISGTMNEEEINDMIVAEIRNRDEESARMFENFHKVYIRTSEGLIESFKKEKIVNSLLKETSLAANICQEIATEVETDIRRLQLKYISASLIREMVSNKLLERRYMQARADYTRIGLPLYDITEMIEAKGKIEGAPINPEALHKRFGDVVAEEYALVKLLPSEISKAHLNGAIHIHDLAYFATRPISLQNDMRWFFKHGLITDGVGEFTSIAGPAKYPDVAISHAVRVLISGGTHLSGGQSFDFFNIFMAPFTKQCSDRELSQLIQTFLYELNQIYAVKGGRIANSTLNFELQVPRFLMKEKAVLPKGETSRDTYYEYEREAIRFLNIFLETMSAGDAGRKPFIMPKVAIKIRDGAVPPSVEKNIKKFVKNNELSFINLRNKKYEPNLNMIAPNELLPSRKGKWYTTLRTGVLQEISINLPQIAMHSKDDAEFFNSIDEVLESSREACEVKRDIIEKRLHKDRILPFLTQSFGTSGGEYYRLENAPSVINLVGLDNAVKDYTGEKILENKDSERFADRVLAYINRKLENYNENQGSYLLFGALKAQRAPERFAILNEKRFDVKDVYPSKGFLHKDVVDMKGWMQVESKLQNYCQGATLLDLEVAEGTDVMKLVYRLCNEYNAVSWNMKCHESR
jgi:anaerobic ribonucleoside-triphosphate reductase